MTRKQVSADEYFAIIPEWVLYADISSNAVRLYCVLRRYADKDTLECFPNKATLAKRMNMSVATVYRASVELIDIGALEVAQRKIAGSDEWTSNLYRVFSISPQVTNERPHFADERPIITGDSQTRVINQNHLTILKEQELAPILALVPDPDCQEVCEYLANAIGKRGLRSRPEDAVISGKNWLNEARLLLEGKVGKGETKEALKSLSVAQIKNAIDYATNDPFWAKNILSPAKLRIQYPRLRMQATASHAPREAKGKAVLDRLREGQNAIESR